LRAVFGRKLAHPRPGGREQQRSIAARIRRQARTVLIARTALPGRTFVTRVQQVLVVSAIAGNRMLETVERRGPKFHPIQIPAQPLELFDQISNNGIRW
jgi:hypothetical protein